MLWMSSVCISSIRCLIVFVWLSHAKTTRAPRDKTWQNPSENQRSCFITQMARIQGPCLLEFWHKNTGGRHATNILQSLQHDGNHIIKLKQGSATVCKFLFQAPGWSLFYRAVRRSEAEVVHMFINMSKFSVRPAENSIPNFLDQLKRPKRCIYCTVRNCSSLPESFSPVYQKDLAIMALKWDFSQYCLELILFFFLLFFQGS